MIDWLAQRTHLSPQHIAVIIGDEAITYATLNDHVALMAARLNAIGVQPGDHVAVLIPNRLETVVIIHALARIGAVMVPLNLRLALGEHRFQLSATNCAYLICSRETQERAAHLQRNDIKALSVDASTDLTSLSSFGVDALPDWQSRPLNLESLQGIVNTSGTTGLPKGAMLTFANHFWSATASAYRLGHAPDDRWLACMPLYHVGGQAIIFRACLYGITVILHDGFDPAAVNHAIDHQSVTLISLVPTMLQRVLDDRHDRPLPSSLRSVLIGGAAIFQPLLDRSLALGIPIVLTYGLTEAASQVATASPDTVRQKPGSVGKPLMFSSVQIVDEENQPLSSGQVGDILVSGPTVMQGYYQHPEATADTLQNGWLRTGDLGYLDEDGDLWIVQRRKDLIVTGGENVYPTEVEAVLLSHPAVKEVCVVGLPDAEWGQRVAAMIVLEPQTELTIDAIQRYCRQHVAGYKIPRHITFTDALPRNTTGKVRRNDVNQTLLSQEMDVQV